DETRRAVRWELSRYRVARGAGGAVPGHPLAFVPAGLLVDVHERLVEVRRRLDARTGRHGDVRAGRRDPDLRGVERRGDLAHARAVLDRHRERFEGGVERGVVRAAASTQGVAAGRADGELGEVEL